LNNIYSFIHLCSTDEIFKSSAFLTESYVLNARTKFSRDPTQTPFNRAFETDKAYFIWLESGQETEANVEAKAKTGEDGDKKGIYRVDDESMYGNRFRLARFGKGMTATSGWEAPDAVFQG
jgi:hypothetical protein